MDRNGSKKWETLRRLVALRKESVDRNWEVLYLDRWLAVALRKESVDRNGCFGPAGTYSPVVALRKESVDRNALCGRSIWRYLESLSARRAWIEID